MTETDDIAPDAEEPGPDEFVADLHRSRNGDTQALDRLLTALQNRLRESGERRVGEALRGRTRVSDILQDAYVEVVRSINDFEGSTQAEFFAWVAAIIENAARRQHRHLTAKKRKPPSRTTELNALTIAYLRTVSSPLSQLQKREDIELIYRAVQQLKDEHREVIERAIFAGVPVPEVAKEIGRTEAATRMLLSRARAALTIKIDTLQRERQDP